MTQPRVEQQQEPVNGPPWLRTIKACWSVNNTRMRVPGTCVPTGIKGMTILAAFGRRSLYPAAAAAAAADYC